MATTLTSKQKERLAEVLCQSVSAYGFKDQSSIYQNKVELGGMTGDARRMSVIGSLSDKGYITLYDDKGEQVAESDLCEAVVLNDVGFEAAKAAMPTFYDSDFDEMLAHAEKNRNK